MAMNKEEMMLLGFEIVAFTGDARSKLLLALNAAQKGEFEVAEKLMAEADECLLESHKSQTSMLQAEAAGDGGEIGFIMVHAQDHLMTAMLLKDLMKNFIELYKRTNK